MQNQIEQKSNDEFEPYFIKCDLKNIHDEARAAVQLQVRCIEARTHLPIFSLLMYKMCF